MSPPAPSLHEPHATLATTVTATAVAAVLSGTPSTIHSLLTRRPLLGAARAAGSLVRPLPGRGRRPAEPSLVRELAAGAVAHGLVSLWWGVVLARVLPPGRRAAWGAVAGVVIHALDLGLIARVVPRLEPMRRLPQLPQLGDHVAFGFTVGLVLDALDRAAPTAFVEAVADGPQATSSSAAG